MFMDTKTNARDYIAFVLVVLIVCFGKDLKVLDLGKNVISGTVYLAQGRTIWLGIFPYLSCFLESVKARAKEKLTRKQYIYMQLPHLQLFAESAF